VPATVAIFALPVDIELWIVLGYVAVLIVAARVVERLARLHFERARRHGEQGFEYIPEEDHYRCAGGERLLLQTVDEHRQLAIYRASASRCNGCPMKQGCTSHDDGRMIFRSLATWSESDVGGFHQRVSAVMLSVSVLLSAVEFWRRAGEPGTDFLILGVLVGVALLLRDTVRWDRPWWLPSRSSSQIKRDRRY
jgi:hypothetical protein